MRPPLSTTHDQPKIFDQDTARPPHAAPSSHPAPSSAKTATLEEFFEVRAGLPIKKKEPFSDACWAHVITPSDIKTYSNLMATPLFLDGNHIRALDAEGVKRLDVATTLIKRFELLSADAELQPEESSPELEQARRQEFKEAQAKLEEARRAWRDIKDKQKVKENSQDQRLNIELQKKRKQLTIAREVWLKARRELFQDRWGGAESDRVTQATVVGNLYRELKVTSTSRTEIVKHGLRTGDLLLVSKGQRPALYYFWHPFDAYEQIDRRAPLHERLPYLAHSSFLVLRPMSDATSLSAALSMWLCSQHGYAKLIEENQGKTGPWRIGKKQLLEIHVYPQIISQKSSLQNYWFKYYYGALSQQMGQEVDHYKFMRDQASLMMGKQANSSLYNFTDLKRQLLQRLAEGKVSFEEPLSEGDDFEEAMRAQIEDDQLVIKAPKLSKRDVDWFKIGLDYVQSDETVAFLKDALKDSGLGFVNFENSFLKSLLVFGSVRSIELSQKNISWGPESTLWQYIIPLERALKEGDMYDESAQDLSDDAVGTSLDPVEELERKLTELSMQLDKARQLADDNKRHFQALVEAYKP